MRCERCRGRIIPQDGEYVCHSCMARYTNPVQDALSSCQEALKWVIEREGRATAELLERRRQHERLEDAIAALTAKKKMYGAARSSQWTPEMREAARQRALSVGLGSKIAPKWREKAAS